MKVGFVGAGAAGGALARALAAAGVPVVAVTGKGPERAHTLAAAIPECAAVPTAQDVADRADLVVLALDVLDMGQSGPGLLNSAMGVGALVGAALAVLLVGRRRLAPAVLLGALVIGLTAAGAIS